MSQSCPLQQGTLKKARHSSQGSWPSLRDGWRSQRERAKGFPWPSQTVPCASLSLRDYKCAKNRLKKGKKIGGFAVCAHSRFPVPHSILAGSAMWDGQQQLGEQGLWRWLSQDLRHGLGFGGLQGDRNTLGRDLCSSQRCPGDALSPLWVSLQHRGFPARASTKG